MARHTKITLATLLALPFGLYFWWLLPLGVVIFHLGHSLYVHRHLTHGCFEFGPKTTRFLQWCFWALNMGTDAEYAAIHHCHHGLGNDPHDWKVNGWWRTFLGIFGKEFHASRRVYMNYRRKVRPMPVFKWWYVIPLSPIITAMVILRGCVLVVTHMGCCGAAINVKWLNPIMWGEEMHLDHHKRPRQKKMRRLDYVYYIGLLLQRCCREDTSGGEE